MTTVINVNIKISINMARKVIFLGPVCNEPHETSYERIVATLINSSAQKLGSIALHKFRNLLPDFFWDPPVAKEPFVLQISLISGLHRKLNSRLCLLINQGQQRGFFCPDPRAKPEGPGKIPKLCPRFICGFPFQGSIAEVYRKGVTRLERGPFCPPKSGEIPKKLLSPNTVFFI